MDPKLTKKMPTDNTQNCTIIKVIEVSALGTVGTAYKLARLLTYVLSYLPENLHEQPRDHPYDHGTTSSWR